MMLWIKQLSLIAGLFTIGTLEAAQTTNITDVRAFGAVCNGATDDSSALQSALNTLSTGGTLLIPCQLGIGPTGVHLSNRSNVTIQGSGKNAGIRSLSPTQQSVQGFGPVLFALSACTRCTIQNLEFDGNHMRVIPLGLDRCTDTIVQNNSIHDVAQVSGGALVSAGGVRNQYLNNTITNTTPDPLSATRGMWIGNVGATQAETSPIIARNVLQNIGATGIAAHAYAAVITANRIEDCMGAGIKIVPPDSAIGVQQIQRNTIRRCTFSGLQVDDTIAKVVNSVQVQENWFEECAQSGIFVPATLVNSTITGNTLLNNHRSEKDGWQGGMVILGANNLSIDGNVVYDTNPPGAPRQDIGIQINADAGNVINVTIANNFIDNNGRYGVVVQNSGGSANNITFAGNTITTNTNGGIHIQENRPNAVTNVVFNGGCFAGNGLGQIDDNRGNRKINPQPNAAVCPVPRLGRN